MAYDGRSNPYLYLLSPPEKLTLGQGRSGSPGAGTPSNPFAASSTTSTQPQSQTNGYDFQPQNGTGSGAQSQSFPSNAAATPSSTFNFSAPTSNSFPTFGPPVQTNNPSNFTGFSGSVFSVPPPTSTENTNPASTGQSSTGLNFGSTQSNLPGQNPSPLFSFPPSSTSQQAPTPFSPQKTESQSNLFGQATSQAPNQTTSFGQSASPIMGSPSNPFSKPKTAAEMWANPGFDPPSQSPFSFGKTATSSAPAQNSNLSGNSTTSSNSTSQAPIFGNLNASSQQSQVPNLFGNVTAPSQPSQVSNMFGNATASSQPVTTPNPFGASSQVAQSSADTSATLSSKAAPFSLSQPAQNPFTTTAPTSTASAPASAAVGQQTPSWGTSGSETSGGLFGRISKTDDSANNAASGTDLFSRISKPSESTPNVTAGATGTNGFNFSNPMSQSSGASQVTSPTKSSANSNGFTFGTSTPQTSKVSETHKSASGATNGFSFSNPTPQRPNGPSTASAFKPQNNSGAPLKGVLTNSSSNTTQSSDIMPSNGFTTNKQPENASKKKVSFESEPAQPSSSQSGGFSIKGASGASSGNVSSPFGRSGDSSSNTGSSSSTTRTPIFSAPPPASNKPTGASNAQSSRAPSFPSTSNAAGPLSTTIPGTASQSTTTTSDSAGPSSTTTPAPSNSTQSQPKIRVSSFGPQGLPKVLDNDGKARYDVAARLRALNEYFQKTINSINPASDDFEVLMRYYSSVREQIGAPLGLFERTMAGTKRKSGSESQTEESISNSNNKRPRTEAASTPSESTASGSTALGSTATVPTNTSAAGRLQAGSNAPQLSGNASASLAAPSFTPMGSTAATISSNAKGKRKAQNIEVDSASASHKRAKSPEKQGSATSNLFKKLIDSPSSSGSSAAGSSNSAPAPTFSFGSTASKSSEDSTVPFLGAAKSTSALSSSSTITNTPPTNLFSFQPTATTPSNASSQSAPAVEIPKSSSAETAASKAPALEVPNFGAQDSANSKAPAFDISKSGTQSSASSSAPAFQLPQFGTQNSTTTTTPTFAVPQVKSGAFMDQFGQKAEKSTAAAEREAKEKRKLEDFDSDEDDEEEFERKYEEEQRAKRAKIQEMAKAGADLVPKFGSSTSAPKPAAESTPKPAAEPTLKPAAEPTPKAVHSWFPQSGGSTPSTVGGKSVFDTPVDHGKGDFGNPFSKADLDKANSDLVADQDSDDESDAFEEEDEEDDANNGEEGDEFSEDDDSNDRDDQYQDDERTDPTYQDGARAQINGDHDEGDSDSGNDSLEAAIAKKKREEKGKQPASSATTTGGRSLFDRIEPNPQLNADGSSKQAETPVANAPVKNLFGLSTSSTIFSGFGTSGTPANSAGPKGPSDKDSLFGSTPSESSNLFGSVSSTATKSPGNLFGNLSKGTDTTVPVSSTDLPESGLFGSRTSTSVPAGTDSDSTPKAGLFFGSSPAGDNTWKPNSPIKFGGFSAAPAFSFTAASPSKNDSNTANPSPPAQPFSGLFGAKPDNKTGTANALAPKSSDVGFNFGGPPKSIASPLLSASNLSSAPSILSSAATSRATSPGGTDAESTGDAADEDHKDEQLNLMKSRPGEENDDALFEIRAKAFEYIADPKAGEGGSAPKMIWTQRGVGPLRVLKNKDDGSVRMVLRGEPAGGIPLNEPVRKNVDYKLHSSAVMFVVPTADGKFQRWTLKVKNQEQARDLAKVLNDEKNC